MSMRLDKILATIFCIALIFLFGWLYENHQGIFGGYWIVVIILMVVFYVVAVRMIIKRTNSNNKSEREQENE